MAVAQAAAAIVTPVVAAVAPAVTPRLSSSRGPAAGTGGVGWRRRRRGRAGRGLLIVAAFGGTYEDGFEDVEVQILNYFTYKATKTVLYQLYEMNPPAYTWLYKGRWIKKCDHAKMYEMISNENLQIMRERLLETVVWPTDDTSSSSGSGKQD